MLETSEIVDEVEIFTVNGILHRIGGPAVKSIHGDYFEYHLKGKLHRVDGAAIEDLCRDRFVFYLDGKEFSFEEWCEFLCKSDSEILFLKKKYDIG